jgi:hypothetical protein
VNNKSIIDSCVIAPEIFLPAPGHLDSWPVIACDQFTSQPDYWEAVESRVQSKASAYHIILPEIYLEHPGDIPLPSRIKSINDNMASYIDGKVLKSIGECMVFIDRSTPLVASRKGLVFAIDLEKYDFKSGSNNLIRATEGTVLERIPPRMQIRKDAILEIPHVQLLVDDPAESVIEPLSRQATAGDFEVLYDIDLPEGGGHVKGFRIPKDSDSMKNILSALSNLNSLSEHGLLFAVGDGNHSLATAKTHWEIIKTKLLSETIDTKDIKDTKEVTDTKGANITKIPENLNSSSVQPSYVTESDESNLLPNHPARFALVELINIYDSGLNFEPIHRVLFNTSFDGFIMQAPRLMPDFGIQISDKMSLENAVLMAQTIDDSVLPIAVFSNESAVVFTFTSTPGKLAADVMQQLIDAYISANPDTRVDYIHGDDATFELSRKNIGMLLPPLPKETFFDTIARDGALPRKTFSMGEAFEKRYYMECKLIK